MQYGWVYKKNNDNMHMCNLTVEDRLRLAKEYELGIVFSREMEYIVPIYEQKGRGL